MRRRSDVWAVCAAALLVSVSGGAHAASSVDLGVATLTGTLSFSTYSARNSGTAPTVSLDAVTVTSSEGKVGFSFNPGVDDYYYGGWAPSYNIAGGVSLPSGFVLVADAGYKIDPTSVTYRVSGQVSVTDSAWVTLSTGQTFSGAHVRGQTDVYDFSVDAAPGANGLLNWWGNNPYYEGPNGTASVFSIADIKVTKIEYRASVAAVPEPATWGMMSLGLVGLVFARRRTGAAV